MTASSGTLERANLLRSSTGNRAIRAHSSTCGEMPIRAASHASCVGLGLELAPSDVGTSSVHETRALREPQAHLAAGLRNGSDSMSPTVPQFHDSHIRLAALARRAALQNAWISLCVGIT